MCFSFASFLRRLCKNTSKRHHLVLVVVFIISIIFYLLEILLPRSEINYPPIDMMLEAANTMAQAINVIRTCRMEKGLTFNPDDVNKTGLIGLAHSPITTTLGDLGAKRTTTNPNFAGLLVLLLWEAGVRTGDAIAIGASGSFPALIVATLAAAKAIGAEPLLICSLAASQWGANDPEFTWLEIEKCLVNSGVLPYTALAVSIGGDKDLGLDLDVTARELLRTRAESSGKLLITESDLAMNTAQRMAIYKGAARGKRIAAFVNIGGAYANLGDNFPPMLLKPGVNVSVSWPPQAQNGVLFAFAEESIPVIHLLNIRELAAQFMLPWDPQPLPAPGEGSIYHPPHSTLALRVLAGLALFCIAGTILLRRTLFETPNIGIRSLRKNKR